MNRINGLCSLKMLRGRFLPSGRAKPCFVTIARNALHLRHAPHWSMFEDCGEAGPDVIGYRMDHITSSVMLFIVHVDFRPEYINFQVVNTRKRLFGRGAISIHTCNICKTVTECLLLKEHSDICALE